MQLSNSPVRLWILLVLCSLGSAIAAVALYRWWADDAFAYPLREAEPAVWSEAALAAPTAEAPSQFTAAATRVTPAVVFVRTYPTSLLGFLRRDQVESATGSGVLISPDGFIVTNNHVIEGGGDITVTLSDKREYEATLVGTDPSTDLALLRIKDPRPLPYVKMGNSDSLRVGEWVLAIGNPFNLESTVTAGIVSAKGRSIDVLEGQDRIESFIQTDAVVNPGNSGGALVNTRAELIGINTAILTRSGRYEGYSFAVPANLVRKIVRDLREYGEVQRGLLGVFVDQIDADLATRLGLSRIEGVVVTRVTPDSGAEKAGLNKGDVILSIDGQSIGNLPAMQELLGRMRPGKRVTIKYVRQQRTFTTTVILQNKNKSQRVLAENESTSLSDPGFELRNLNADERRQLGVDGIKVVSVLRGSAIAQTNMEPGFIITAMNDRPVASVGELSRRLQEVQGKVVLEGIYEGYEGKYYYAFARE